MDDTILFPEIIAYNNIVIPITNLKVSRSRRRRMVKKAKKRLMKVGADRGALSAVPPTESLITEHSAIGLKREVGDVLPPSSQAKHNLTPQPEPLGPLLSDPLCESSEIERLFDFAPPSSIGSSFTMDSSDSGVVVLNAPMMATVIIVPEKKRKQSVPSFAESIGCNLRSRS